MNKTELISAIASESGLTKKDSKKALDATIKSIENSLSKGEKVSLVGFGAFLVTERSARKGVNPASGKAIRIPAKKVVKFRVGSDLADAVK